MTFIVHTVFPPALNNLYVNVRGKGRTKSSRYRTWQQAAGWDYREAQRLRNNPPAMTGPVAATIELVKPDRRKRDIDGLAKALLDSAVEHGVIEDDSQVADLRLRWVDKPWCTKGARLIIWPIEDAA